MTSGGGTGLIEPLMFREARSPDFDEIEDAAAKIVEGLSPGATSRRGKLHAMANRVAIMTMPHGDFSGAMLMDARSLGDPVGSVEIASSAGPLRTRRKRAFRTLEAAIKRNDDAHLKALKETGIADDTLVLLQSWLETMVEARALQRNIEAARFAESAAFRQSSQTTVVNEEWDVTRLLSAVEIGQALGVTDESVRRYEKKGKLFSISRPARQRGREYPALQAWPGIVGQPLERVLEALDAVGSAAFGFFTSPNQFLGGLTPVEAMQGRMTSSRELSGGERLLVMAESDRLIAVVAAAEAFSAN